MFAKRLFLVLMVVTFVSPMVFVSLINSDDNDPVCATFEDAGGEEEDSEEELNLEETFYISEENLFSSPSQDLEALNASICEENKELKIFVDLEVLTPPPRRI